CVDCAEMLAASHAAAAPAINTRLMNTSSQTMKVRAAGRQLPCRGFHSYVIQAAQAGDVQALAVRVAERDARRVLRRVLVRREDRADVIPLRIRDPRASRPRTVDIAAAIDAESVGVPAQRLLPHVDVHPALAEHAIR